MGPEKSRQNRHASPDQDTADPSTFEIFYSSGVFGENAASTDVAIEALVKSLQPRDRLSVAAAIRQIVRQHSEDALRRVENRMQLAQEVGRIGCFEIDMRDGTSVGTPAFFEIYGVRGDRGAWSQQEWLSFVHPEDRPHVIAHLKEVARGAEMTTVEYRVVRADGAIRWTASRARIETAGDGRQLRAYGIQQDITERKVAELALAESEEHHRRFIEVNPACFWTADPNGRMKIANASAAACFGVPMEVSAAVTGPPLVHPRDRTRVMAAWRSSLASGEPYDVEHRMRWPDGKYRWVHARAYPRRDDSGEVIGWYGATEDVHARKLAEQRMSWVATHDSLTGLTNRLNFRDCLKTAIDRSSTGAKVALLLLDLDGFKLVNDSYGHDVGDRLLVAAARRLRQTVGRHGIVSRLGGDEFTIILPRVRSDAWLQSFADRVLQALNGSPLLQGVEIGASIGLSTCPGDGVTVSGLLKNADLALYAAKAQGRGRWVRYHGSVATPRFPDGVHRPRFQQGDREARPAGIGSRSRQVADEINMSLPRRPSAREDLRAAADYGEYVYWVADASGRGIDMSHQWSDVTGFGVDESLRDGWRAAVHPCDYRSVLRSWRSAGRAKRNFACELRLRHQDGSYRWVQMRAKAKLNEDRQVERWYGTLANIEDRKVAELALRTSEAVSRSMLEASVDCIKLLSLEGKIEFMNAPGMRAMEIDDFATIEGQPWCSLWPGEGKAEAVEAIQQASLGETARFHAFRPTAHGAYRWWDVVVTPIPGNLGTVAQLLAISRDTTIHRRTSESLRIASEQDALTGLANRGAFQLHLDAAALRAMKSGTKLGLLVFDLDHFKSVNDSLGHPAGDHLLKTFAERLKEFSRSTDFVARLGGDEFAVIVEDLKQEDDLLNAATSLLDRVRAPVFYDGSAIPSGASIGGAIFPRDAGNANDLLNNADIALYANKADGGDGVTMFHHHMRQFAQVKTSQINLARIAVSDRLILPYYQPKVRLDTGQIYGFEALLRWVHPSAGIQSPDTIFEAFGDYQLASAIGEQMQLAVARDVSKWCKAGVEFGTVSINASPSEFLRNDYAERLLARLAELGTDPRRIEVEVTEHAFLNRAAEYVSRAITILSSAGVRISLDDFGTGHSSLSHIKDFPVDILKIDRSFVREIERGGEGAAIVTAVIGLAHNLALEVVAEGVETEAQKEFLVQKGCDFGQGYLFGHAIPASCVPRLINGDSDNQVGSSKKLTRQILNRSLEHHRVTKAAG